MSQLNKLYRNFIILQEDERGYSISNDKTLSGYSKIEAKGEKCKISFYAQNLRSDSDDYCVLAVCSKKDTKQLVNLGKVTISDGGKAEVVKEYFLDDVGGIGLSFDKITGAAIAKMRNDIPIIVMCGFVNGEQPTDNWKNYKVVNASNEKSKEKIEFIKKDDKKRDKKDKEKSYSKNKDKDEDKMKHMHKKDKDDCDEDDDKKHMHKKEKYDCDEDDDKMKHMHKKEKHDCDEDDDKMKHMHKKEKDDCDEDDDKMKHMHKKEKHDCDEDDDKMKHMHKKEKDDCDDTMKHMHKKDKGHCNEDEVKMKYMHEKEKKYCNEDECDMKCRCEKEERENPFVEDIYSANPFGNYETNTRFSKQSNKFDNIYNSNPFGDYETNTRFSKQPNKFDDYESKIEELSGNFKIRGSVGEYFESIASGFEVLPNEYREIKNCKWYRVPVKDLDDLCNMTNYNRYTVAYYPMLNYYPYIRKHGYFNLGFKCDRDGNLKYIVYGIPGDRSLDDQPYEGKTGFVTWVNRENRNGMGSWLMFYDFRNSTVVVPME